MSGIEVVGVILGLLPLMLNAITSTQYDIDRLRRLSTQQSGGLDSLLVGFSELEQAIQKHKDSARYLTDNFEPCARTLSLPSAVASSCWQLARSKVSQGWMTREDDGREWEDTRPLEETCVTLMDCVQSGGSQTEPAFWKLQRWILRLGEESLFAIRIQLPEAIRRPSPSCLFVCWVATTLAVVAYYEARPRHRYRTAFLFGGVLVATIVGIMEGSSVDTTILTNMPWCIALGMLIDVVMRSLGGGKSHRLREKDSSLREEQYRGMEKATSA